ncbi:RNA polymerase sigma factor [Pleomorphovibrio marinus]|uniref:RNA polymerase sigma factor n=1 Tax=Pleomorphovibrio marinus TaxID=2164132 RepID=UPI001E321ADC|nr:RNA polymerase sigma-70 factor [Pleomorphovibrio marinus]
MRPLLDYSERELVILLRQGDRKAFDELYSRYIHKLLGFAYTFLTNKEEAEETVQEIFIKIWEKRRKFNENRNFKAYLFLSVKNHLLNKIRNEKRKCSLEAIPMEKMVNSYTAIEQLSFQELESATFKLIESLPNIQQQVFTLRRMEGLSNAEIATKMNLSKRTVEHHLYLATKALKEVLLHKSSVYSCFFIILFF